MSELPMSQMPFPVSEHEQLWFEMLVDGELCPESTQHLFTFLDEADGAEDSAWKRCALTLLNEKLLQSSVRATCESENPVFRNQHDAVERNAVERDDVERNEVSAAVKTSSSMAGWLAWGLSACVMFGLGLWVQSLLNPAGTNSSQLAQTPDASAANTRSEATVVNRHLGLDAYLESHTIYEVENSRTRATYLMKDALPELFLRSMVLAGHQVRVEQDSIDLKSEDGTVVSMPLNKLQITKHQSL